MATNWAEWDIIRTHRPRVAGWYTSKDGLTALGKRGISLDPYSPYGPGHFTGSTDIRRNGRLVGLVYHPMSDCGSFAAHAQVYTIDADHKGSHSFDSGVFSTHDAAISAILRQHGIQVPRPRPINTSTVVARQGYSSRVRRAYTGPHFTPTSQMDSYARRADSIATRIRMNSVNTDPMTGLKVKRAAKTEPPLVQPVTLARIKALYGKMLKIHRRGKGPSAMLDKHLAALQLSPEHHHRLVAEHMAQVHTGGLHVGDKIATAMVGTQPHAVHALGDQVLKDRPNHKIGGVYYSGLRQLILPDDTHSGSVSTGSHELGHALDYAYGTRLSGTQCAASSLPHFQQVYNEVTHMHDDSDTVLNPYYTDQSTSNGPREMWAEGYAAWLHGRDLYRTADERALLIGHEIGAAPSEKLRVGRILQNYFDIQDEKMKAMA